MKGAPSVPHPVLLERTGTEIASRIFTSGPEIKGFGTVFNLAFSATIIAFFAALIFYFL